MIVAARLLTAGIGGRSGVVGLEAVNARLAAFDAALKRRMEEKLEALALEFQRDLVANCPVDQGELRAALASPDAVSIKRRKDGLEIEVGFLTPEQKRKAFYAFFVEFGTKGYEAGQKRFAGKTKKGQARFSKVKRKIPARPAHPFFRPSYVRLAQRFDVARREAHALALVDMARGG